MECVDTECCWGSVIPRVRHLVSHRSQTAVANEKERGPASSVNFTGIPEWVHAIKWLTTMQA